VSKFIRKLSYANRPKLESPVLNEVELSECRSELETAEFSTLFEIAAGPQGLETAVRNLAGGCREAVRVKIRSDDSYADRLGAEYSYIPPLLAVEQSTTT